MQWNIWNLSSKPFLFKNRVMNADFCFDFPKLLLEITLTARRLNVHRREKKVCGRQFLIPAVKVHLPVPDAWLHSVQVQLHQSSFSRLFCDLCMKFRMDKLRPSAWLSICMLFSQRIPVKFGVRNLY
jgi:hypothetical protein